MTKLCFHNRDNVFLIEAYNIAYIKADGNYVIIIYISSMKFHLNCSISQVEDMINKYNFKDLFVKLGRSYIFNINYIQKITPAKNIIVLSDGMHNSISLMMPQKTLRKFQNQIIEKYDCKRTIQ